MSEFEKSSQFNLEKVDGKYGGLSLQRKKGEGVVVEGFGQVFLITKNTKTALVAFQSPTDFNCVEFQRLELDKTYILSDKYYIGINKSKESELENGYMFLGFPRDVHIVRQELVESAQNLSVPIDQKPK